jgi:frataxin-like iron-binding protein CyaY
MKNHYRIHQQQYASNSLEYNDEILTIENDEEDADMINSQRPLPAVSDPSANGVVIFSDMLDWLKSDFEELDLKEQVIKEERKQSMR